MKQMTRKEILEGMVKAGSAKRVGNSCWDGFGAAAQQIWLDEYSDALTYLESISTVVRRNIATAHNWTDLCIDDEDACLLLLPYYPRPKPVPATKRAAEFIRSICDLGERLEGAADRADIDWAGARAVADEMDKEAGRC